MAKPVPTEDLPDNLVPESDIPEEIAAPSAPAKGLGSKALDIAKDVVAAPVGLLDAGLSVASQAAAYPLSIAAGAGEQISPWGKRSEAREPPLGPNATPEEIAARDRREGLYQHRDNLSRGNAERKAVSDALTYTPKTASGRKALEDLSWLLDKTLGRVGRAGGNAAAFIAKAAGAEPPEQEEARATAAEATNNIVGAAMPAVARGVGGAAGRLSPVVGEKAIELGRKALGGVGSPLSARKPIPEAAVREALSSGAIGPLSTVKGIARRLSANADDLGGQYAEILARLEESGVHGPVAQDLARRISGAATDAELNSIGSSVPGFLAERAAELEGKPLPISGKGRLGLMQAEKMKRNLQREAKNEYNKLSEQQTPVGEAKEQLAGIVREEIENAVDDQAALAPDIAAEFRPVKNKLSNTLQALRPATEGAARAARRKAISLTDTITGSAAGAATGNPIVGALAALGHGIVDRRLPSTGAWSAYQAQRLLEAIPQGSGSTASSIAKGAALAELLRRLSLPPENGPGPRWPLGVAPAAADDTSRR